MYKRTLKSDIVAAVGTACWLGATAAQATPITASGPLNFGFVLAGQTSATQTSTVKNQSGSAQNLLIGSGSAPFTGSSKTVNNLGHGASVTSNPYAFAPTTAGANGEQAFSQTVSVTDAAHPSFNTSFILNGTAVAPIGSVTEKDAGNVYITPNHSGTATVTVSNAGHGDLAGGTNSVSNPINLNVTSVASASGAFAGGGSSTGFSLTDGTSRSFNYSFIPTITGTQSTAINYAFSDGSADGGNKPVNGSITIHGTGVAPLASANGSNAGDVLVGQQGSAAVTVTNTGNGNLDTSLAKSVTDLNGTVAGLAGTNGFTGAGGSLSLQDGTSKSFSYTFAPSVRGTESKDVGVSLSNGLNNQNASGTVKATVSGQGVAPVESVSASGAGNVRIGTSGTASVTVSNIGDGNLSGLGNVSNLHGTVSGPVGGDAALFNGNGGILDLKDSTGQTFTFGYSPTQHALNSTSINVNFSNGNSDNTNSAQSVVKTLQGRGVGPIYDSVVAPNGIIDFGKVGSGATKTEDLLISNVSTDPGDLTLIGLTLLKGTTSGKDAANFSLEPGTIGTVLSEGDSIILGIDFAGLATGLYNARLTVLTDQNADFGSAGDSLTYNLEARVVPEPSGLALLGLPLGIALLITNRQRRTQIR